MRRLFNSKASDSHPSIIFQRRVSKYICRLKEKLIEEEMKISSENERLLKRIVEITFRRKKKASLTSFTGTGVDHADMA
jgi:hypothetical protein